MTKPVSAWEDNELLGALKMARAHKPLVVEERAHKAYKLMLKTEAARRGILPVGQNGEDQNFRKPSAEIFELAVRLGSSEIFEQEIEARRAAG